jgi:hypothetical protein
MRLQLFAWLVSLSFVAAVFAQTGTPQGGRSEEEIAKELKKLREQIDELVRKEQTLKKEQQARKLEMDREKARLEQERRKKEEVERKAKDEAERKKHYAKVEVRGKLTKTVPAGYQAGVLQVAINELSWTLHFDKKELQELAEKNVGKGIVVTGTVVNKRSQFQTWPGYPNPGWPGWPNPGWPYQPEPWRWPQQIQPWSYSYESPVVINVETLKLAED